MHSKKYLSGSENQKKRKEIKESAWKLPKISPSNKKYSLYLGRGHLCHALSRS